MRNRTDITAANLAIRGSNVGNNEIAEILELAGGGLGGSRDGGLGIDRFAVFEKLPSEGFLHDHIVSLKYE